MIYSLTPPTSPSRSPKRYRSSSRGSSRSSKSQSQKQPILFRLLSILIPTLAIILLITTIYLFHLHHSHHPSSDDSNNFDSLNYNGESNSVSGGGLSPGNSALKHKMDLANFLLNKYEKERHELSKQEAINNGWKGGNESNFIKLVTDISNGDTSGHNVGGIDTSSNKKEEKRINYNKFQKEQHKFDIGTIYTWTQLQTTLLNSNILPKSIPKFHTARGFSGLPLSQTPALIGAQRGTITCPNTLPEIQSLMDSMLAFWNAPRGTRDLNAGVPSVDGGVHEHVFIPPPRSDNDGVFNTNPEGRRRYLTFEPDTGGWNNIRMSLENVITLAAVSGRTLVLPPDQIVYLLEPKKSDQRKGRNYHDFFNLTSNTELLKRVPIITSEKFLELEGGQGGLVDMTQYNTTYQNHLKDIVKWCEERKKSDVYCEDLYDHYLTHGQLSPVSAEFPNENCFIFDVDVFTHGEEYISKLSPDVQDRITKFCKKQDGVRKPFYYNQTMHEAPLWHFETMSDRYRLLIHYYVFMLFTDPKVGNYIKRLARDHLRYHDEVYCAAGKIILSLQYEDYLRNQQQLDIKKKMDLDEELVGGYSSLHIRRGDLQFKEVKFSSLQWYENTKEIWKPQEILYIATDEMNQTFFNDFKNRHSGPLRFFNDYKKVAELDNIDPTLYGMIDTVVAARGTVFAGTWFSTFSGYIIRLRGYYGMSKFYSYYSWLDRKYFMHRWMNVGEGSVYAREYPVGWTSIDGDTFVDNDNEPPGQGHIGIQGAPTFPRNEMDRLKAEATAKIISTRYSDGGKAKGEEGGQPNNLARGVSGRPMSDTPALIGAQRGKIQCDADVNSMAYWNEPQGDTDMAFTTPFADTDSPKPKYLVFTPDKGGFNNIRMSFEIIFIIAAALGRILVLPPEQPMYLLRNDGAKKHRGLDGFFDMDGDDYRRRVKVMSMEEFLLLEGRPYGQFPIPPENKQKLLKAAKVCVHTKNGGKVESCDLIHEYLASHATTPNITATHHECLIFDKGMYEKGIPDDPEGAKQFCDGEDQYGPGFQDRKMKMKTRRLVYVTKQMQRPPLLYIQGAKPVTRMLAHYYGYLHFTDVKIENYYKRYIRDLLHFRHEIFCAAGKIVKFLQEAGKEQGFSIDSEGGGGYSSLHVRRGDFQYTKMRIDDSEWYANTEDVWLKNEVLYIATDEKDTKGSFEPFRRAGHKLYFLSDFTELAGLDNMDPNWKGMIDVAVSSRGRAFAGTFRSTFSGYINRLRGYYGISMKNSYFGQLDQKHLMHEKWHNVNIDTFAKEWPDAWVGIDADVAPSQDIF